MTNAHNQAIAEFKSGNVDKAWAIAIQDDGLAPGVSKEVWVDFAMKCIANEEALKNIDWYA